MATDWYAPATKLEGPISKTNSGPRSIQFSGIVAHSAEGYATAMLSRLKDPSQLVSWHFSNMADGTLYQHYSAHLQTWHAGPLGNPYFVGIEHEGKAGEPLTQAQIENLIAVIRWVAEGDNWSDFKRGHTLMEHKDLMQTACPSDRIPWSAIIPRLDPTSSPAPTDLILALVSAAEFTRREWNYGDLLPADKEAIKWLSAQL